ncbi:MAG: hypothetical protein OEX83_03170, partial [Gammaproteobacteria bacterium]|nr:hypothetical protein [Gammaproteobacteria bacterium]
MELACYREFVMLRLTEIRLPIDHTEAALPEAILARLEIPADQLVRYSIVRRAHDARKRTAIFLVYTLDVELQNESVVLARFRDDKHVVTAPETH